MEIETYSTGAVWEETYGYSRAVRAGDQIVIGGTAPVDEEGRTVGSGDGYAQAARCYEIIDGALRHFGTKRSHVVRCRMYVTDIGRADEFGRAHRDFFAGHAPCLTMVEVAALIDPSMLVEIEAEARI